MRPLIDQFPEGRLSPEEESRLARAAQRGDADAANHLVLVTMREALLYTKRTCRDSIADDERVSLCYRKLLMCVQRFDPARGIRFFAFCKAGLRGQMKTHWESQDTVRNASEIVSVDRLEGWSSAGHRVTHRPPSGKPALVETEDDHENSVRERVTGEVELPETEQICFRDRWAEIELLMRGKLSERQRMVLALTYKSGLSFPDIGKLLGRTRSLIHAIHRGAIQKIRDEIAADGRLLKE